MRPILIATSLIVAMGLAGCDEAPPANVDVMVVGEHSEEELAFANEALAALQAACSGVLAAAEDVVDARVTVHDAYDYQTEAYGWTRQAVIEIALDDDVDLPIRYHQHLTRRQAFDHHRMRFMIGTGHAPGIIVDKAQGAALCERGGWADANIHIPTPVPPPATP